MMNVNFKSVIQPQTNFKINSGEWHEQHADLGSGLIWLFPNLNDE